jgi:sterol desaturase/sphingolipid hydroxylase (fatty acid hydroxylase superfamily)
MNHAFRRLSVSEHTANEQTSRLTGRPDSGTWSEQLKPAVRQYGYGTIMLGALLVLWWGVEGQYPLEWVANGLYILMIGIILGLESWIPFQQKWGNVGDSTRADVIYFLLAAPIDFLAMFLFVTLLAGTAQYHQYLIVFDIWPSNLHVLLQLLLVTQAVDFFKYWYHRWTHEIPLLWRFHSVHHSLDRLEMLRASYFYPFDIFLTVGLGTLTMLMCGVRYEIIVFHNVYAGITGLLNHSNADLECGFFDTFLNSPGHHRAHHSVGSPGRDSNYGSFFNFTDRIFGTRYLPEDQQDFGRLGLDDSYDFPKTFLKQLAVPFRWRRVHRTQ